MEVLNICRVIRPFQMNNRLFPFQQNPLYSQKAWLASWSQHSDCCQKTSIAFRFSQYHSSVCDIDTHTEISLWVSALPTFSCCVPWVFSSFKKEREKKKSEHKIRHYREFWSLELQVILPTYLPNFRTPFRGLGRRHSHIKDTESARFMDY